MMLDELTELDLESELNDEEFAHAIPFCQEHKHSRFFPVAGTIVQVLCGRLIRVKQLAPNKKKCPKCKGFHGKVKCNYCGKEIYG